MIDILEDTIDLANLISHSEEGQAYLSSKEQLERNLEAQDLIKRFKQKKDRYEEAQRFGRFHPNYHDAKKEARVFQEEMLSNDSIRSFLKAEENLDKLLYDVSLTLAQSVSSEIMVPNSKWNKEKKGCKCKK